ncbi:hypothetical protein [Porticoccus sp.]|uniref:hypothetical protein n=1 Tax=Porticoccus sp. TaxID=2024853 RepID=UPI003F69EE7D
MSSKISGKTKAIIAHITLIGWIIALVLNMQKRDSYTSFYIRQYLGIMICGLVGNLVFSMIHNSLVMIWAILILVAWVISLVGAITDKETEIPYLGRYFQDWFKGL